MARNAKYHVEIKDSNAPWRSNAIELAKSNFVFFEKSLFFKKIFLCSIGNKHGVPLEGIENQLKRMTNYTVEDALKATERRKIFLFLSILFMFLFQFTFTASQESLKPSIQEKTTIAQEKNNEIMDECKQTKIFNLKNHQYLTKHQHYLIIL